MIRPVYILKLFILNLFFVINMAHKKISGYIINLKEVMGKGSYGEVYRGEHEQTKNICAIKVLNKKLSNPPSYHS